jgi:Type II secretion system (T2SS), protein E, N-terminal domain
MPLLKRRAHIPSFGLQAPVPARSTLSEFESAPDDTIRTGLIGRCANPGCRSGWLHLFRHRSVPVFEGGWTCSPECTQARLVYALRRELDSGSTSGETYRHRIPIGLLMLEKGWITRVQLREALQAKAAAGCGRLGEWLIKQHAIDETIVTRALALQWSCPVLPLEELDAAALTFAMPRLFLDAFGALPLRAVGGKLLYLGFEQSPDPVLAFAVGRMTGLRVESGIVSSTLFRPALSRTLNEKFPTVQLAEAVSESAAAHLLARSIERFHPVASRLVRVHDCVWLRMWSAFHLIPNLCSVSDVVCSMGAF